MLDSLQSHAAVSGTDSLASELFECRLKIGQHGGPQVENVDVEAEPAAFRHGPAIERIGSQDEGTRPVPQSAGSSSQLASWLEQAGISRGRCSIAQNPPQSAADHVAAFPGGE